MEVRYFFAKVLKFHTGKTCGTNSDAAKLELVSVPVCLKGSSWIDSCTDGHGMSFH